MKAKIRLEDPEDLKRILPLLERELQEGQPIDLTFPGEPFLGDKEEDRSEQVLEKENPGESQMNNTTLREQFYRSLKAVDQYIAILLAVSSGILTKVLTQIYDLSFITLIGVFLFAAAMAIVGWKAFKYLQMWRRLRRDTKPESVRKSTREFL